ncbi:MAG: AMP-binding protein [Granulosicoccus sp.]
MIVESLLPLASLDASSFGEDFQWSLPERFNIADAVCRRHADGSNKLALIAESTDGSCRRYTFDEIDKLSSQLANVLVSLGVVKGDRVAVILPQRVETPLLHLAAHRIAAISLPLSVLFGDEALRYRLFDSGSRVVVTDSVHAGLLASLLPELPNFLAVLCVDEVPDQLASAYTGAACRCLDFYRELNTNRARGDIVMIDTHRDDPAFLLYTSGTTGPPKGALIPHRALIGNLTGFECSQNGFPQIDDVLYTPADWAWTGGLLDGLLPAWYYGVPVVALDNQGFAAERVAALMSRHKVTCSFMPPTALKMLRSVPDLFERHPSSLRSIMSAGEAVGKALHSWGLEVLGLSINEMCGQTEHNYLIGNCSAVLPVKPGSMGKAYPGHRVAILGDNGALLGDNEEGEIVAHRDDPVHFLGYWRRPEATAAKYTDDWFHTGDIGKRDSDGYLWFLGRADDVINSAGYRIGPGEIENCALQHSAVLQVAAIGVPDPDGLRGDIVKLCVVLKPGELESDVLRDAIRERIRYRLAAYEYPRIVEFFDSLPMTTTGKVQRAELRRQHSREHTR